MTGASERTDLIEVIIPHRSRWDLLERCLDSIEAQTIGTKVCVVDNASTDATLARLRDRPSVRVLPMDSNVGFGRAVNAGVATSEAKYVLVLNNDMVLEKSCVEDLLNTLQVCGPRCVTSATQLRLDGRVDTYGIAVDRALGVYDVGHGMIANATTEDPLSPLGPSGGAMAISVALFREVGGYDDNIFAYLEDVDLAIRFGLAEVPYVPTRNAVAWHAHSSTLGSGSAQKNFLMGWSRGYLLWKYGRSLDVRARAHGLLTDLIVYGGQAVIDRNIGALRGRWAFLRQRRDLEGRMPRKSQVLPLERVSLRDGLQRRRARR